jgi:hypothetical protein
VGVAVGVGVGVAVGVVTGSPRYLLKEGGTIVAVANVEMSFETLTPVIFIFLKYLLYPVLFE